MQAWLWINIAIGAWLLSTSHAQEEECDLDTTPFGCPTDKRFCKQLWGDCGFPLGVHCCQSRGRYKLRNCRYRKLELQEYPPDGNWQRTHCLPIYGYLRPDQLVVTAGDY